MERGASFQVYTSSISSVRQCTVSLTGWGVLLQDLIVAGTGPAEERELHINFLEMKVVQLAVDAFRDRVIGKDVVLMSDTTIVVAYLRKLGGTVSLRHVQVSPRDSGMVGTTHGVHPSKVHSGEE